MSLANVTPSSVTLIFYRLGPLRREPLLNIVASALQGSSLCHCEVAIGETVAADGSMVNVARVFNDAVGVEVTARTGRNPNYCYVQLGSTDMAVARMLAFAKKQVGKPFSQLGMARSIFYPRRSDYRSFYCAELCAAILQVGGLMHPQSNPGAATPSSLYELYTPRAAVAANPFKIHMLTQQQAGDDREPLLRLNLRGTLKSQRAQPSLTSAGSDAGNRQHFRRLTAPPRPDVHPSVLTAGLTLHSLTSSAHARAHR